MLIFNMENIEMIVNLMDTMFQKKTPKKVELSLDIRETDGWQMVSTNLFDSLFPVEALKIHMVHLKIHPIEQENFPVAKPP